MLLKPERLVAAVGIYTAASAQLLVRPALMRHEEDTISRSEQFMRQADQQQPLNSQFSSLTRPQSTIASDLPPFKAGQHTLTQQDNTTCATYGESQWSGTVDVTDEHRLFFWFFDSRSDPENDPIIIWINGGPGGSSLMGLLNECGPCWLDPGANETIPNEWSWNNNASMLFIDQPAGVGFASLAEGSPIPKVDLDGAEDFQTFLNIFFEDVFPDRSQLPIHFAAESYGGHYAPVYVNHILQSRAYDGKSAFWGNLSSLILVDAVIDFTAPNIGSYELLCSDFRGGDIINQTACEAIRLALPECESLGRSCDLSYDGYECWGMLDFCENRIASWYWEQVELGKRNPFNKCDDPRKGNITAYLNQPHVKAALNFPPSYTFDAINFAINTAYIDHRTPFKPTTAEVSAILDAYRTPNLGDIRLLVLQGNEDYVVNTPGNIWAYDNLRWSGQPEYRITAWQLLDEDTIGARGFWKATRDGRLAFVAVDGAGHTVPGDVREGSYHIAMQWIEGGWHT